MRIAEVIGRVTLCKAHPSLVGAKYVIGVPLSVSGIQGSPEGRGEPFVIYDALGVGQGAMLGVSEGTEAAAPFLPEMKPVDAYAAAILDTIEVTVV